MAQAGLDHVSFWMDMTLSEFVAWIADVNAIERERKRNRKK